MQLPRPLLLLVLSLACLGVGAQVSTLALPPATSVARYAHLPVLELNRAQQQQLTGQFENALLTYNSALAFQPNWVPVLTARAELYYRLGRELEARRDEALAYRQDPYATSLFMARGHNALLSFLALYPQDWFGDRYGFTAAGGRLPAAETPQAYYSLQRMEILEASDTALAVRFLRQKIANDVPASRRTLEEIPRDYSPAVRQMLMANLAMLNHDYAEAVNLYTAAAATTNVKWPELYYNRGLGYVLLHNYVNGCADLSRSAQAGFAPAKTMFSSLCNL